MHNNNRWTNKWSDGLIDNFLEIINFYLICLSSVSNFIYVFSMIKTLMEAFGHYNLFHLTKWIYSSLHSTPFTLESPFNLLF